MTSRLIDYLICLIGEMTTRLAGKRSSRCITATPMTKVQNQLYKQLNSKRELNLILE